MAADTPVTPQDRRRDGPLWLLDVDGVLNAVTRTPDQAVWPDWRHGAAHAAGRAWPIAFSPSVTAAVRRLHEQGAAEVRWLTTWRRDANGDLRELLGVPAFEVVGEIEPEQPSPAARGAAADEHVPSHGAAVGGRPAPEWWKLAAVRDLLARLPAERPLIWTDDDLRFRPEAVAWVRTHERSSLLVAPDTDTGLTPADLERIEAFCASPQSGALTEPAR
jgi:hypothetical protein